MSSFGPLVVEPGLVAKPWGGRRLARFSFDLPAGRSIGEAHLTGDGARVRNGAHAGASIADLVREAPEQVAGPLGLRVTHGRAIFPILLKLIDAAQDLSIQVHPADHQAAGQIGKTEAWLVLDADPGSVIYAGLRPEANPADFAMRARAGQPTAPLMRTLPAQPGMAVFLPAGTVHALGAGVLIYEIQQPSGITLRLDDWGRVDESGRPRDLHVEEGLAVMDAGSRPEPLVANPEPIAGGSREVLVTCPFFAFERINLAAGQVVETVAEGSPQCLTLLAGRVALRNGGGEAGAVAGETVISVAADGPLHIVAGERSALLRAWVPGRPDPRSCTRTASS